MTLVHTLALTKAERNKTCTHVNAQKQTMIYCSQLALQRHWRTDRRAQARLSLLFPFRLRPFSTDSCFLTKPTLLGADPVIMRLCPEPQATREQCQQLGADLLNGLASPRSQRELKAAPHCLGGERIFALGNRPCPILKVN